MELQGDDDRSKNDHLQFKNNILYLWSPQKELKEKLYDDKNIRADFKVMTQWIPPLLSCGYTWWRAKCSTCETMAVTLLEIMDKDNVWQNLGRGFFISRIIKLGHSINMSYCIGTSVVEYFTKIYP